jgi:Darcynin, domain of unknown function
MKGFYMTQETKKTMVIFWLLKTNPSWLALPPIGEGGRFDFAEKVFKPILGKYPGVNLRFFDIEAYSAMCTDIMMWTVIDLADYNTLVESLRETRFWDDYFQVLHILPGVKDGYADHYDQDRIQG